MARSTLEAVANKLDSFDVLKSKEVQYIVHGETCDKLTLWQDSIIAKQDSIIINYNIQEESWREKERLYKRAYKVDEEHIRRLEQKNWAIKTREKAFLIGGGVAITALTTALIISLTQ
ncbi:MAG: hypothetical protein K0U41_05965 [Gammaproteobacteria bacterium]|nr:hypothetical protein [Gammaproteobacteria bacterium]